MICDDPIYLSQVDSTIDYCKRNLHSLPSGTVVYTDNQTKGKGSKGRSWTNFPGEFLAVSMLLKGFPVSDLGILPLLCGLAEYRMLASFGLHAQIKWPNDLLLEEKKISGILCESVIHADSADVVCGIGINLNQSQSRFDAMQLPHACSLATVTGHPWQLVQVLRALLAQWEGCYQTYQMEGFGQNLLQEYQAHCYTLGRQLRVEQDGTERYATAISVEPDGMLRCELDGATRCFHQSDATVRGLWGRR